LLVNNVSITDPSKIANEFNNYFANVASSISDNIHPAELPDNYFDPDPDHPVFDFSTTPVTHSEISDSIKQLQIKKTLDCNGLSTNFISKISLCLSVPLKHLVTLSLHNGIVPAQLKIAKITPIFKSGDKQNLDNYRPISLLNVFSKIFEKVVHNRLMIFLDINNILSPSQFGFRKKHATVHPLTLFTNSVAQSLNAKEHSIAIFCDLKKAFDTVDHKILLKKLSKIGVCNSSLKWFESYLTNRYQYVCVGSSASKLIQIKIGVPQGSILGPLLFLIYINDLPKISKMLSFLFADDTTLFASHRDPNQLIHFVNEEFQKVVHFFRAHKLSLHPAKTKFILFSNSTPVLNMQLDVFINSNNAGENALNLITPIDRISANSEVPAIKFLGIYIDPSLSFKYHISTVNAKISKALYFLRSAKNFLSECSLKALYYAIVHCHLVYGIQIWGCTSSSNLKDLEKKQKDAIRIVTHSSYNAHTEPLFKKLKILPLYSLISYFKIQFMFQFKNNLLPEAFNETWITNQQRLVEINMLLRPNNDEFFVPFARISQVERLPLISFPKSWNEFENEDIKSVQSKNEFNSMLKTHFINLLNANFFCSRLLCPHCHIHDNSVQN
jgi:Reverse transcriptase (RNA-dependent DNA polymerase)